MIGNDWMIHTVTRKTLSSIGAKGDPVMGSASTFRARVEKKTGFVRGSDGAMIKYNHVLVTTTNVNVDDIFWFPSILGEEADDTSSDSAARRPVGLDRATNKAGSKALIQLFF